MQRYATVTLSTQSLEGDKLKVALKAIKRFLSSITANPIKYEKKLNESGKAWLVTGKALLSQ